MLLFILKSFNIIYEQSAKPLLIKDPRLLIHESVHDPPVYFETPLLFGTSE